MRSWFHDRGKEKRKTEVILSPGLNSIIVNPGKWRQLPSLLWAWRKQEAETAQFSEFRMTLLPFNLEAGRGIIYHLSLYPNGLVWYQSQEEGKIPNNPSEEFLLN